MPVMTDGTRFPPGVETVLTIWGETLNEAKLSIDDACRAAAMQLGHVLMNCCPNQTTAQSLAEEVFDDIFRFMDANWDQVAASKPAAGNIWPDADELTKRCRDMLIIASLATGKMQGANRAFKIELSEEQLNTVSRAMASLPLAVCAPIMQSIFKQVADQSEVK